MDCGLVWTLYMSERHRSFVGNLFRVSRQPRWDIFYILYRQTTGEVGQDTSMAEKIVEKSGILERKAIIKNADMTEDMQQDAIECATAVSMCTVVV